MLKKVPLDEVFRAADGETAEAEPEIDFSNCSCAAGNGKDDGEEAELLRILRESIGIQRAMACILLLNYSETELENVISVIGLSENPADGGRLRDIGKFFRSVYRILDGEKKAIACQVSEPTEKARGIFISALNQNMLNQRIGFFYSGKAADDCHEIALYRYVREESADREKDRQHIEMLKEDPFFRYALYGKQNGINMPGILISRFRLNEIDRIPYIESIAASVERLYIMVTKSETAEGKVIYEKRLTWDKVREE